MPRIDIYLACALGIWAIIMALVPIRSPFWIVISLVVAFALSFYVIWTFPWIRESIGRRIAGLLFVAACLFLLGDYVWPKNIAQNKIVDKTIAQPPDAKLKESKNEDIKNLPKTSNKQVTTIEHQHRNNILTCGPAQIDINGSFLGMSTFPQGEGTVIHGFQADLINMGDKPIKKIDGFIQIDRSEKRFYLMLNKKGVITDPSRMLLLPLHESIGVLVPFEMRNDKTWGYVREKVFLDEYIPFTLFLDIDGTKCSFNFTKEQIEDYLIKYHRMSGTKMSGPLWK